LLWFDGKLIRIITGNSLRHGSQGSYPSIFQEKKIMKRILVPCDFSPTAQEAFMTAVALAQKSNGSVFVLNVVPLQALYEPNFTGEPVWMNVNPELAQELQNDARKAFNTMNSKLGKNARMVEFESTVGGLIETIQSTIDSQKIDLVVMGTSGSSGLAEIFIGSNTEKVVRFASAPVLAVREAPDVNQIDDILLPTTCGLNQTAFISEVKKMQVFFKARLHLLLINTPLSFKRDAEGLESLDEFAKHYQLENYERHFKSYHHEGEGIMDFAVETKMDIIAMGTHARKGLSHLFTPSVTERVLNHTRMPIWTYHLKK
jgi:nucleotide-binding universal stress UspA family protein